MLKLDWNILWTIINLLILFIVLKKVLFNRVMGIIEKRTQMVQNDLDSAAAAKSDAEQMKKDYEEQLKTAHDQALDITNTAKLNAQKECELMIENAREESAKIIKDAQKTAVNEKSKALDDAKVEIADLALFAAAKVINKKVDSDSDKQMAEDFISEVGESK
ncbi:MAG: F0F1 ATP synthase subunit B [Oscillospiraceae bacterium]